MTVPFALRLAQETRCPVCGGQARPSASEAEAPISREFACGSRFDLVDGVIGCTASCPTPSDVACDLMNREARSR